MKKIKSYVMMALVGLSVSSCKDFLTLMPLNEVVLENFWTDMSDVESVLMGTYAALESSDCVVRMSIWGEMRSDNIIGNQSSQGNNGSNGQDDILQITRDNILQTNQYANYKCFYDVINRANTVLHFAPLVAEKDPNYTGALLQGNEAEAIAIRSLAYWYLIRAYKDVPYTTMPSIDDTHDFFIGQTPFNDVLDSLIYDLERVKNWANNSYTLESHNTGRITRAAIHAMLADMYLWKGDYEKCVEHCEWITARKIEEYQKLERKNSKSNTVELINGYPLITETPTTTTAGNAYNEIFGKGNAFEVIFELPYDQNTSNPFVSSYYNDKNSKTGKLKALPEIGNGFGQGNGNSVFIQPTDGRYYQNIADGGSSDYGIVKYVLEKVEYDLKSGMVTGTLKTTRRENTEPNWIVYRYTDVLLMEAEAKVMMASAYNAETQNTEIQALFQEAFNLVDAVNRRAICKERYQDAAKELKFTDYNSSVRTMEDLVLSERRRELMFEGKRWFDLVRMAMREGNTKRLFSMIEKKYDESNRSAVRIKMTELDALFFPLSKDEIKINDKLKQNPVYIEDEFIEKATK